MKNTQLLHALFAEQPMDDAWTTDGRGHCMSAKAARAGRQRPLYTR